MPFIVKGFHSDNGGEFINWHLESYYRDRESPVEMTRGRPGAKNDCPHVEQKNHTHVRLLLGWRRIEDPALVQTINELYEAANLLSNFFCANRHLIFKERRGSKYYKKYDAPATPWRPSRRSGTCVWIERHVHLALKRGHHPGRQSGRVAIEDEA